MENGRTKVNLLLVQNDKHQESKSHFLAIITGSLCHWQNPNFVLFVEYLEMVLHEEADEQVGRPDEQVGRPDEQALIFDGLTQLALGFEQVHPFYPDKALLKLQTTIYFTLQQLNTSKRAVQEEAHCSERERKKFILNLIEKKTGLFRLSFTLGWLGNHGALLNLSELETAGRMLGLCWQIIQDTSGGSSWNSSLNICDYYTHNDLIDLFTTSLNTFAKTCTRFKLFTPELKDVYKLFIQNFKKNIAVD
jgi:hypothetical protein